MKTIMKIFLQGLVIVVPLILTIYCFYWLCTSAEAILGEGIKWILPEGYYVPGLGMVAGAIAIFAVGILMSVWITRQIVHFGEDIIQSIPLVKTLYGSIKDLMSFFAVSGDQKKAMEQVVLVSLDGQTGQLLGFLTRDSLNDIYGAGEGDQKVAVYLPMSYQIGGFTVFVAKENVQPIDMKVEDAMRFAMTAGVSSNTKDSAAGA